MQRRDFVKAIVAASVTAKTAIATAQQAATTAVAPSISPPVPTAPGPLPWMRGLLEAKPLPMMPLVADMVAETNAHFFTSGQMETLVRLCDVLLPPLKGYPGALDAGAPQFLDFLIGVSPADRQGMYQAGLDRLEHDSKQHFGISFSAVSAAQADQLLRPWLKTWLPDNPPTEPFERFVNVVHGDIRTATVNSEAWSNAAQKAGVQSPNVGLFWYPVDPDLHRDNTNAPARTNRKGHHV